MNRATLVTADCCRRLRPAAIRGWRGRARAQDIIETDRPRPSRGSAAGLHFGNDHAYVRRRPSTTR